MPPEQDVITLALRIGQSILVNAVGRPARQIACGVVAVAVILGGAVAAKLTKKD